MSEANQNKLGYGTLNDISKPIGGSRERQSTDQTFIDALTSAAQNQFSLNALSNTGPYKGVVLRIENQTGQAEAGGWLANALGSLFGNPPPLVSIKVRIPEVHAALPIPDQPGSVPGPHQKIIDMYPTFVAQSTELKAPTEGAIVYVDYGSKNTWSDPIYLRPLIETPAPPGAAGQGAAGCHGGPPGTTLAAPKGDSLPGANKAATNSGLPLLKRKAAAVESGEYKLIKGERGGFEPSINNWEKAIKMAKLPGKYWIGYLHGNDTSYTGDGDSKHKSEDKLRDTIIFVPNVTDLSFKDAQVEVIIYLHDFNEFDLKTFEEVTTTLKQMALDGRNFVLVMPELPWSTHTTTPQSRTDEGMDEYDDWYDNVMKTISTITGAKFTDGDKSLFVSVVAKNAGAYVIRNSSDSDEFHGTGVLSAANAQRIIMSVQSNISISGEDFKELIDEWGAEVNPRKTECAFLCSKSMTPSIKGEVDELKEKADDGADDGFPHNVILKEFSDQTAITAGSLITWINFDKAKAKEEKEAAAQEATKNDPKDDEAANKADDDGLTDKDPPDPTGDPPKQTDGQAPPAKDPAVPPSQTPKKSATPGKKAEVFPATPYDENRVKVKDYGSVIGKHADEVLISIDDAYKVKSQKIHKLANQRMMALSDAYEAAVGDGKLKVTSAWRKHKWKSKAHYDSTMIKKYGSVKAGRKLMAYNSPHETGLAMDWGNHGLEPKSATTSKQKKTKAFAWLKANAHLFGLTPYKHEPWHWEIKISYDAWVTGNEFVNIDKIPGSYATRVGSLGTSNSQIPSGPGSGGGAGGTSGAPCVSSVGGSGGGGGAAFTPGQSFSPAGAPSNVKIVSGPQMIKTGKNKKLKKIQMFVIHETGGSPKPNGAALAKKLTGKVNREPRPPPKYPWSGVHFWQAQNGDIVQCAPLTEKLPHANWSNYLSVGIEIGCYSTDANTHNVTAQNERGVLVMRPDGKGHIAPPGGKMLYGSKGFQLPTEVQVRKTWDLILWIAAGAGGTATGTEINLPIKFPCVPDQNVFYWTRWAGRPERNHNTAQAWWKSASAEAKFGIVGHHRWNHGDGMFGEFYCLARAKGFSSEKAYYACVGAVASLEKINGARASRHPDSDYVALGKKIMGNLPLNPKYGEIIQAS